jgi:hypothetical protein
LQGRRLDAPWLHALLAPDLVEDTLAWLGGTLTKETDPAVYAAANARLEADLRNALAKLSGMPELTARGTVQRLAEDHKGRCSGPWAARGQSRLALAVQHLAHLAGTPPLPAHDAEVLAAACATTGWQADDAAIRALEAVAPRPDSTAIERLAEDRAAVVIALRAIYMPWLQRIADVLQNLLPNGMPRSRTPSDGDVVLFVDGLRRDLAHGWRRCCASQAHAWRSVGVGPVFRR